MMIVLTDREDQVMHLVAEGLSNKLIATRLDISESTAKFHVRNACKKLGSSSRTKAAVTFMLGLSSTAMGRLALANPANLKTIQGAA